jgi:hypothetical protein
MWTLPVGVPSPGEGRAPSDHRGLELVHVRPVLLDQLGAQSRRSRTIPVVAEELHAPG